MSRANPRFKRNNPVLPSLANAAAFRITASGVIDQQMWLTNFDYINLVTNTPNPNAEANLGANWLTACATQLKACLASDVTFSQLKITCLTIPTRLPGYRTTDASFGNGTVAGSHYDSVIAGIITKETFTKGQHGRGRNYIPGVPLSFVTAGTNPNSLNATGITAYNNLVFALVTLISDGTNNYSLGVTQRTRAGAAATNGQIQGTTFNRTLLGTVRRRRVGRGK